METFNKSGLGACQNCTNPSQICKDLSANKHFTKVILTTAWTRLGPELYT